MGGWTLTLRYWSFAWVTQLERLKGVKDKVKQTRWAQRQSGSGVRVDSRTDWWQTLSRNFPVVWCGIELVLDLKLVFQANPIHL